VAMTRQVSERPDRIRYTRPTQSPTRSLTQTTRPPNLASSPRPKPQPRPALPARPLPAVWTEAPCESSGTSRGLAESHAPSWSEPVCWVRVTPESRPTSQQVTPASWSAGKTSTSVSGPKPRPWPSPSASCTPSWRRSPTPAPSAPCGYVISCAPCRRPMRCRRRPAAPGTSQPRANRGSRRARRFDRHADACSRRPPVSARWRLSAAARGRFAGGS